MSSNEPTAAQIHGDERVKQIWFRSTLSGENFIQTTLYPGVDIDDASDIAAIVSDRYNNLSKGDNPVPVFIQKLGRLYTWPLKQDGSRHIKFIKTTLDKILNNPSLYPTGESEDYPEMDLEERISTHAKDEGWV